MYHTQNGEMKSLKYVYLLFIETDAPSWVPWSESQQVRRHPASTVSECPHSPWPLLQCDTQSELITHKTGKY